ncbi:hypothetical protein MKW92_039889, partial [Papaver armeniacum]
MLQEICCIEKEFKDFWGLDFHFRFSYEWREVGDLMVFGYNYLSLLLLLCLFNQNFQLCHSLNDE